MALSYYEVSKLCCHHHEDPSVNLSPSLKAAPVWGHPKTLESPECCGIPTGGNWGNTNPGGGAILLIFFVVVVLMII